MDSYREHPSDFDLSVASESPPADDVSSVIGTDERRMHVRAYNHWVSLLDGRDFPSIEDLEPGDVADFSAHSVLLDFTCGGDNPAIPFIGASIRDECGFDDNMRTIGEVPSRSLLSRLTDHYLQIIANRSPVGFEAEFENPTGVTLCYRGILMPFSSDGESIDFIYGVINWKHVDAPERPAATLVANLPPPQSAEDSEKIFLDQPLSLVEPLQASVEPVDAPGALDSIDAPDLLEWPEAAALDDDAGLADRLCVARGLADAVKDGEGRTRSALYRALGQAYDFALAADASPDDYAELLTESGLKAQARAPMTPIVKLIFGIDYDKARLTEFAAALAFARRQRIANGTFQRFIEGQPGGLKALVAAERAARRPLVPADDRDERARNALRNAPPLNLSELPADEEFALVLVRRHQIVGYEAIALIGDPALVDRAVRLIG